VILACFMHIIAFIPADTVFSLILGPDIHRDLRGETDSERILGGLRWISERI